MAFPFDWGISLRFDYVVTVLSIMCTDLCVAISTEPKIKTIFFSLLSVVNFQINYKIFLFAFVSFVFFFIVEMSNFFLLNFQCIVMGLIFSQ